MKFLATLEGTSSASQRLSAILDTLTPMTNALRTVWVISRHYSTTTRWET